MKQSLCFLLFLSSLSPLAAQCPPQGDVMEIGMGLNGLAYWSPELPFKNLILMADDKFLTFPEDGSGPWNTELAGELSYDSQGYPIAIPQMTSQGAQKVRLVLTADGYAPQGNYAFLYDGQGQISFYGATVKRSETPGRILVEVNDVGNGWLHIDSSNPADHLRNFRLVRLADESSYESDPFTDEFLGHVSTFYTLRFMDWFHTNNWDSEWAENDGSPAAQRFVAEREWSERASAETYSQAGAKGIAYEYAIKLANQLHRRPWICVPHNASDDYMRQMARLFRDSLSADLDLYLEYSNEVWNGQFHQFHYIARIQDTRWPGLNHSQAVAARAGEMFKIWREEFGADSLRIKRVCGTQTGNPWIGDQAMGQLGPNGFDALAITWYFGIGNPWGVTDPQYRFRDRLEALGAAATPQDVVDLAREDFLYSYNFYTENAQYAAAYNKPLITYEGGSHIIYGNTISNPALLQTMFDAEDTQAMYDLYDEVIDSMRNIGVKVLMPFVLTGKPSIWGDWGHLRSIFDQAPYPLKYQALLDNLDSCREQLFTTSLLDDQLSLVDVKLFPVPTRAGSTLQADLTGPLPRLLGLSLVNQTGQVIWSNKASTSPGKTSVVIPTSATFAPGLYFLQVTSLDATPFHLTRRVLILP